MPDLRSFAEKCSRRFQCSEQDLAEAVLLKCLPVMRKPLARLILVREPEYFQSDLYLINEVGNASTIIQVREIIKFHNKQPATQSFMRRCLKIRLSRSKLQALAESILGETTTE